MTTYIFCYNRPEFLANAVASWERFDGDGKLVVFDDRSDMPAQQELLRQLRDRGIDVILGPEPDAGQPHHVKTGGLHWNMKHAVELSLEQGLEAVHFMQDDMQMLAPAAEGYREAMDIAKAYPDACIVGMGFHKVLNHRHPVLQDGLGYRHVSLNFSDTGVVLLDRLPLSAMGDERETSDNAGSLGLRRYLIRNPVVAQVPFVPVFRNRRGVGETWGTRAPLMLHPVDTRRLKARPVVERPFEEHFVQPWGWSCRKPYVPRNIHTGKWIRKCLTRVWRFRDIRCFPRLALGVPYRGGQSTS